MAREQLDITVVILNNRAYAILQLELMRVGARWQRPQARSPCSIPSNPNLDFVAIAEGSGVPAKRATTARRNSRPISAPHRRAWTLSHRRRAGQMEARPPRYCHARLLQCRPVHTIAVLALPDAIAFDEHRGRDVRRVVSVG